MKLDSELAALRDHIQWSMYPEIGVEAACEAIAACARGDCDAEIEGAGEAATVVVVLGLEEFVQARLVADLN